MKRVFQADHAMRAFQAKNETVFTQFQILKEAREVAENELRTAAKNLGEGYETEDVACEYVMPMHKEWSPTVLRASVSAKILDALGVIKQKEVVDEKMLKMLVKSGKIKKSVMDKALVKIPTGAPRVTITIKDAE